MEKRDNMKEVIIATGTLGGGGAERVFLNIGNEMSARGLKVRVLVTGSRPAESYPLDANVIVDVIRSEKRNKVLKIIDKFNQFRKYLKEHEKSTVISFFPDVSAYCVLASFGMKIRNIVSERNDPNIIPRKKYMKIIRNMAFRFADSCVFQTQDAMDYFPQKVREKGVIINNPINSAKMPEINAINARDKIILAVGRIVPQKNFLMLIKAWELIEKKHPEYVLHIYGDKSYRNGVFTEEIQNYIIDHGLDHRVYLMGFSSDIYSVMNKAMVYVSSSDFEGMSNTMLEAMAMGVPTIATDCPIGGAKTVIKNGENGILTPVGDEKKMANAIERLLESADERRKLSYAARKVRVDMSIQKVCDEWIKLL